MSLDLDMIVETDLALVQFRIKVRFDRQRLERGALDLIKQRTPASSQVSHHSRAMRGVSGVAKLAHFEHQVENVFYSGVSLKVPGVPRCQML